MDERTYMSGVENHWPGSQLENVNRSDASSGVQFAKKIIFKASNFDLSSYADLLFGIPKRKPFSMHPSFQEYNPYTSYYAVSIGKFAWRWNTNDTSSSWLQNAGLTNLPLSYSYLVML